MTPSEELYMLGFIDKCAELGVDPEALMEKCADDGLVKKGFTLLELLAALATAGGATGAGYGGYKLYKHLTKPKEMPVSPIRRILGQLGQKATGAVEGIKGLFAESKEGAVLEDYTLGFIDKCAELGVDPEKLIKWASKLRQPARTGAALDPGTGPTLPVPPVVAQPNPGLMSRLLSGRGAGGLGPGLQGFGRRGLRGGLTSAS